MDIVDEAYILLQSSIDFTGALKLFQNVSLERLRRDPRALVILTHAHRMLRHFEEAEFYARELLYFRDWKYFGIWSLGSIKAKRGNFKAAREYLEIAAKELKYTKFYPVILLDIAEIYQTTGKFDEAKDKLLLALKESKERGNFTLIATVFRNLSQVAWNNNQFEESMEYAHKCLELSDRYNLKRNLCKMLVDLVGYYGAIGDFNSSREMLERASLERCSRIPDVKIQMYINLAVNALRENRVGEALQLLFNIEQDVICHADPQLKSKYLLTMGTGFFRIGLYKKALASVEEISSIWRTNDTYIGKSVQFFKKLILIKMGKNIELPSFDKFEFSEFTKFLPILVGLFYTRGKRDDAVRLFKLVAEHRDYIGNFMIFWNEMDKVITRCVKTCQNEPSILKVILHSGDGKALSTMLKSIPVRNYLRFLFEEDFPPYLFLQLKSHLRKRDYEDFNRLRKAYRSTHPLKINTFGRFELWIGNYIIPDSAWKRNLALDILKFFVTHRNKWLRRDFIFESFWPGESPKTSSQKLRVYLNFIRKIVEPWKFKDEHQDFIKWKSGAYGFFTESKTVTVDAEEFEKFAKEGLEKYAEGDFETAFMKLEKAVAIYRGDFLEEERYYPWIEIERLRLRKLYFQSVVALAKILLQKGQIEIADFYLSRAFWNDPTDEDIVEIYLKLLVEIGRPAEALKIFSVYKQSLEDLYKLSPSKRILDILGLIVEDS